VTIMARKRLLKKTIAFIRWFDASYQRGECTEEELVPKVELESAGLLVAENEESVSIALDQCDADGTWRYIEHIPRVNILSMRRLSI
jgi:hypothetical protein